MENKVNCMKAISCGINGRCEWHEMGFNNVHCIREDPHYIPPRRMDETPKSKELWDYVENDLKIHLDANITDHGTKGLMPDGSEPFNVSENMPTTEDFYKLVKELTEAFSPKVGDVVTVLDLSNYRVGEEVPFRATLTEITDYPCYWVKSLRSDKVYELYASQIWELDGNPEDYGLKL